MSRLPPLQPQFSVADVLPDTTWTVTHLQFDEAIDALYQAIVDLETDDTLADTGQLLGATCEILLQRGEHSPRAIFGVITGVDYLGHGEHHLHARILVEPAFALCQQQIHSRIWQGQSVQEILRALLEPSLGDYQRTLDLGHLERGAAPRDYCVQYRESDFAFACRLLEEEGISWLFIHDREGGSEVLTLCDDAEDYPRFANVDGAALLPIIAHAPEQADLESIQRFEWARRLTATSVALSEFDPASPGAVSKDEAGETDDRQRIRRIYDHSQRRLGARTLAERARDRLEALRLRGSLASCQSNAASLAVGQRFTLSGVHHEGAPETWLVLAISHDYQPDPDRQHPDADQVRGTYVSTLRCAPVDAVPRPLELTPKPRVQGPQTATVVGEGEIDVDAQGRIQVQFHWPEDPDFAAGASCRVRCAQSWAGPGWGAQFIPRVGMEVVVEFLAGDPDRPLVTGCVYNGGNEPPFAVPGNATQSGWRSNSSPGGGGYNELRFEDAAGGEEIFLHAQRDSNAQVRRDEARAIGRHASLRVGERRDKSVGSDEQIRIGANQRVEIAVDRSETIGANMALGVGGDQAVTVAGARQLQVGGDHSEVVAGSAGESVALAKAVTVGGVLNTVVGAAMNTSVAGACLEEVGAIKTVSVGGSSGESVVGGKRVDAATIDLSAKQDLQLTAGGKLQASAKQDLRLATAGKLAIAGKSSGLIELDDNLTIKVGKASITLKKDGTIALAGVKITVDGKKSISLKAKKIDQN